jgi:ADP-ribosylglycohydrolase
MKTTLHVGRFLALVKEGHWEYADRSNATGAAIILAETGDGKILLVEQYRIPVHSRTIESPAGIIGDTLHASIWALLSTNTFHDRLLREVNLGGDTDTTGRVAAGLAGVAYGISSVPPEWIDALPRGQEVE